jgi:hypothetical protein
LRPGSLRATTRHGPWLACLLALAPACAASVEGVDDLRGWKALRGEATLESGSAAEPVLRWSFEYGSDSSVLARNAGTRWERARTVKFSIRSDRDGPLVLRLDHEDGRVFLHPFDVSKAWKQVRLALGDFKPFGGARGEVQPALITRAFVVDLAGADTGARGARSVWIKDLSFSEGPDPGEGERVTLILVAMDRGGNPLSPEQLERRGLSAGRWCFLTDAEGIELPLRVVERQVAVDGRQVPVPALIVDGTRPATLQMLFWPAGQDFNVWLPSNGGGKGIQASRRSDGVVLLNLDLARTRLGDLLTYEGLPASVQKLVAALGEQLSRAGTLPSLREQAAEADRILEELLRLSRDAVRRRTREEVAFLVGPGPPVNCPSPKPRLLDPGRRVTIQLSDPAFRIGVGQSFGFADRRRSSDELTGYYRDLRSAGFNHMVMPLFWDQIAGSRARAKAWEEGVGLSIPLALGYTMQAHGIVQVGAPPEVKGLKGPAFTAAAKAQISEVVRDYGSRFGTSIVIWEAVNEPSSNPFGGLAAADRTAMVSELVAHLRASRPGATVLVNDYDWRRGIDAGKPWSSTQVADSLRFFRELARSGHPPDVLGLEWYPGLRVDQPRFKLDIAEPCPDLLHASAYLNRFRSLGIPLQISESNFPGEMKPGDRNGFAWGRWDEEAQAQAAVDTLYLALSKPFIAGWVWWSITDDEPWNRAGGLFTSGGRPKPVLRQLEGAIASLKSPVRAAVAERGRLPLPRLPGTYRITLEDGFSWEITRAPDGQIRLGSSTP